jgi:hypothetical protein
MLMLVLALVAAILAVVELIRSRGLALLAWAVLALALIVLIPQVT